jgi:tetratricopeptide (TPR) repeat protein
MQKTVLLFFIALFTVIFSMPALYAQDDLYEKGRRAYIRKDYEAAVKYLSDYVARKPDPEAFYLLGYANYEVKRKGSPKGRSSFWGDTETAEYFKKAYLIDPKVSARSIDMKKEK